MTPTTLIARAAVAIGLLASTPPAYAETRPCAERGAVVERLRELYGEARLGFGLDAENLVELFASSETGSWTILVTTPGGMSCLLAAGEMWQDRAPLPSTAAGKDA